jgi:hypothetical protein
MTSPFFINRTIFGVFVFLLFLSHKRSNNAESCRIMSVFDMESKANLVNEIINISQGMNN